MGQDSHKHMYGVDVARILAMFLVVLLHVNESFAGFSLSCSAGRVLRIVSVCCIDIFALISGYVGIRSTFRPSRMLSLWIQTVFIGVVVVGLGDLCGWFHPALKDWGKVFMPISSHAYWYLTAYFLLFLVAPFINVGFRQISRRVIAVVLSSLIVFVVLIPSLNPYKTDTYVFSGGCSFAWLLVCYLIGGGVRIFDKGKGSAAFWLAMSMMLAALNVWWPGNYTSPTVLALAFCLFLMCLRLRINSRKVQVVVERLSSSAFGVYLWHGQPMFFGALCGSLAFVCSWPWYYASVALLGVSVLIYLIVVGLESVRMALFERVGVRRLVNKIDSFLELGTV